MTGQSVVYGIPRPASPRYGPQVAPGQEDELLAPQCTRCGAVGTHYLTCPDLRLPPGYRLSEDCEPGHREEPCITDPIGPVSRPGPGRSRGGPDHPDWPRPPRH